MFYIGIQVINNHPAIAIHHAVSVNPGRVDDVNMLLSQKTDVPEVQSFMLLVMVGISQLALNQMMSSIACLFA